MNARMKGFLIFTAGDDFISIFEEEIIFQPGEVRKCVQFTVIEDDIVEGEEALSVQIQSPVVLIGEPQMADINIIDSSREYIVATI